MDNDLRRPESKSSCGSRHFGSFCHISAPSCSCHAISRLNPPAGGPPARDTAPVHLPIAAARAPLPATSAGDLLPVFLQSLVGYRHARSQLLREQGYPVLLQHPAPLIQAFILTPLHPVTLAEGLVLLPETDRKSVV